MLSYEISALYCSLSLSTTFMNTPPGYFPFKTDGKYPSTKSPNTCRDSLVLYEKNVYPFIAIPLAKNPIGKGSAFLNLWIPFYW